jgi:hypothetical protein
MLISAVRRLGWVATFGLGLWLINKVVAERADRRLLNRSTAPWPSVPLDRHGPPDLVAPAPAEIMEVMDDEPGDEPGSESTRGQRQIVALSRPGPVISLQLPRPDQTDGPAWVEPDAGSCPLHHPVKAKLRSHLYHEPGMLAYRRTNADRCYPDGASAEGDGFVRAKR